MDKNQELACNIVELFEDLLSEKEIEIPCADQDEQDERHEDDNQACLYGMEYWSLVDKITQMLSNASK